VSQIVGRFGTGDGDQAPDDTEPEGNAPSPRASRRFRRHLASAVTAVTTVADGGFRAAAVAAVTVVSVEPLQVLASVDADSRMCEWIGEAGCFGVSILPWRAQVLADRFAGNAPLASPSFAGIEYVTAVTGAPLLGTAISWADCKLVQSLETGDHRCFIGEALALGSGAGDPGDPLIYVLSRYGRLR